ncbi:MAG: tRNA dihydrouridine synthase DusB [Rubrivivax sp. SCN 70-15]|nr:MAG: tRNA dihydrouridine synthase DusB [Rubrivivax sp. SCN 70-15]
MKIGTFELPNRLFVAPMAGVTDRPFRQLCRRLGAGHAVSEMVTSKRELWASLKTSRRADHAGEPGPVAVQIAGVDPAEMADAARYNIDRGAQIIDINMGCPAKKVCSRWAGSALMQDEPLALAIVEAVVAACAPRGVPVTLKMRTGWCAAERNALRLARAAEAAGIALLTVHGRTREQGYQGRAEHETVAAVKAALRIPVVANGDIDTPETARAVLERTGADALMIGRAAQGRPWIFREIGHFLATGERLAPPATRDVRGWLVEHLHDHYALYGETSGVRSARKHIGWAVRALPGGEAFRAAMNTLDSADAQLRAVTTFFDELADRHPVLPAANDGLVRHQA